MRDGYVVDVSIVDPDAHEYELVLREFDPAKDYSDMVVYWRRRIVIHRDGFDVVKDSVDVPVDREDAMKFEDLTQRLFEDQRHRFFPDLEN